MSRFSFNRLSLSLCIQLVIVVFLTTLVGGCSLGSRAVLAVYQSDQTIPIPEEMQELCDEDGGYRLYKTAEDVRGFFIQKGDASTGGCDNVCWSALGKYGYDYVESEGVGRKLHYDERPWKLAYSPGFYRFTLEKSTHPNCNTFLSFKKKYPNYRYFQWDIFDDHCIAVWPVNSITARYELRVDRAVLFKQFKGQINKYSSGIWDRASNEPMATSNHYYITSKSIRTSIPAANYCPAMPHKFQSIYRALPTVLKPKKD